MHRKQPQKLALVLAGEHEAGSCRERRRGTVHGQRTRGGGAVHQQHAVMQHLQQGR